MRRCLLFIFLLLGSAQASSFNFGAGVTYLGIGGELELTFSKHGAFVVGLGGLPVPGASFAKFVSREWWFQTFALTSAYIGYKYLFSPGADGFFMTGRYGPFVRDFGADGVANGTAFNLSGGYRYNLDARTYVDAELGGLAYFENGYSGLQGVSPTPLINFGFRF